MSFCVWDIRRPISVAARLRPAQRGVEEFCGGAGAQSRGIHAKPKPGQRAEIGRGDRDPYSALVPISVARQVPK
jgi:hypothetical protein